VLSLPLLERERLLGGNWKIRPAAGLYFKREWCAIVDEVPPDLDVVRYAAKSVRAKTDFFMAMMRQSRTKITLAVVLLVI
jgi:hypothetical protein